MPIQQCRHRPASCSICTTGTCTVGGFLVRLVHLIDNMCYLILTLTIIQSHHLLCLSVLHWWMQCITADRWLLAFAWHGHKSMEGKNLIKSQAGVPGCTKNYTGIRTDRNNFQLKQCNKLVIITFYICLWMLQSTIHNVYMPCNTCYNDTSAIQQQYI